MRLQPLATLHREGIGLATIDRLGHISGAVIPYSGQAYKSPIEVAGGAAALLESSPSLDNPKANSRPDT